MSILLIVGLIIVLIVVLCGVIFATFMAFMVVNKIIKRHLHLLDRRQTVEAEIVVDLDDPSQVAKAQDIKEDPRYLKNINTSEQKPLIGKQSNVAKTGKKPNTVKNPNAVKKPNTPNPNTTKKPNTTEKNPNIMKNSDDKKIERRESKGREKF